MCVCGFHKTLFFHLSPSGNAAKEFLVPYFSSVIESLKGFLTDVREEMRSLQTQALGRNYERCALFLLATSCFSFQSYSPSLFLVM